MKPTLRRNPDWSTSSLGAEAVQAPGELTTLATQLGNCNDSRGRFFRLRSAVDIADGFARARFVTTLLIVGVAVALTWLFF